MESFPKLFIPGPTHVPDYVMQSLTSPQIGHRTSEFSKLMSGIVQGIQKVLYTNNHVYLVSHAATGLWEMGIKNSVTKGILHTVNGSFSSKWSTISKECGYETGILDYEWGKGVKPDDIDKHLSTGKYDVLAMVHNETSTGVMSPLEPIAELLQSKCNAKTIFETVNKLLINKDALSKQIKKSQDIINTFKTKNPSEIGSSVLLDHL